MIQTLHAKLLAIQENVGDYTVYVFENLATKYETYVACVRFPNWNGPVLQVGDVGFVKCRQVLAGIDSWYDAEHDTMVKYKFTDIHFENFIHEKQQISEIIL